MLYYSLEMNMNINISGVTQHRISIFISLAGIVSYCVFVPYAHPSPAAGRPQSGDASDGSSPQERMEGVLHSLALYILAAEMLSYLEDGAGGTETLAQKYSAHPGWIPAFGKAIFDAEGHVLYVPLGQCMWKVFMGDHGDLRFSLLEPTDSQIDQTDKKIMAMHLFCLINDADLQRDFWTANRNALAAESLLYPRSRRLSAQPTSRSRGPFLRDEKDLSDHL